MAGKGLMEGTFGFALANMVLCCRFRINVLVILMQTYLLMVTREERGNICGTILGLHLYGIAGPPV